MGLRVSGHTCHATGCTRTVPPKMLMCGRHWAMVPADLQADVWATYRRGQETTKDPSAEYLDAAHAAIEAVAKLEAGSAPAIKALTLWQPWASLIAVGAKHVETRSWSTTYRGKLAIHAAAHSDWPKDPGRAAARLVEIVSRPLWLAMRDEVDPHPLAWTVAQPRGAVVATCTVDAIVPTGRVLFGDGYEWKDGRRTLVLPERERPYGDYSPDRFVWMLGNIEPVDPPVPARGRQQLWDWAPVAK